MIDRHALDRAATALAADPEADVLPYHARALLQAMRELDMPPEQRRKFIESLDLYRVALGVLPYEQALERAIAAGIETK